MTPVKLCECGCGEPAPIAKQNYAAKGYVKGEGMRYIRGHRTMLRTIWLPEDRGYETPCHIWQGGVDGSGYGLGLKRGGGPRVKAHRAAWIAAHGPVPDGLWVLHRCDVPACVNAEHLFLGTPADNIADMIAKGRGNAPRGARHVKAKLSERDAALIRGAAASVSNAALARAYSIDPSTVSRIRSGDRWKSAA